MIKFFQFIVELLFAILTMTSIVILFIVLYPITAIKYKVENLLKGINDANVKKPG